MAELDDEKRAAELEQIRVETESCRLDMEQTRIGLAWKKAYDATKRGTYAFSGTVDPRSVGYLVQFLEEWEHAAYPGSTLTLRINSFGGSVYHGLEVCDKIDELHDKGFKVNTHITGCAASMGGSIAQHGNERIIGRNSWLHLHEVSTGAMDKAAELLDTAERAESLTRQICDKYAARAKEAIGDKAMTGEQIHEWIRRHERWISADQAYELGFVDRIV